MSRSQIHADFVREFHKGAAPAPVTDRELTTAEQALGVSFPEAHRTFVRVHGAVSTPAIAEMAKEADVQPVVRILSPEAIVETTRRAWRAGLRRDLVVFASGPSGEAFCFERSPRRQRRPDDAAVWHFDPHVTVTLRLTDSFDDWLKEYLDECYVREDSFEDSFDDSSDEP